MQNHPSDEMTKSPSYIDSYISIDLTQALSQEEYEMRNVSFPLLLKCKTMTSFYKLLDEWCPKGTLRKAIYSTNFYRTNARYLQTHW